MSARLIVLMQCRFPMREIRQLKCFSRLTSLISGYLRLVSTISACSSPIKRLRSYKEIDRKIRIRYVSFRARRR